METIATCSYTAGVEQGDNDAENRGEPPDLGYGGDSMAEGARMAHPLTQMDVMAVVGAHRSSLHFLNELELSRGWGEAGV